MRFEKGDRAVLKSQVTEGKFYDVIVIGEPTVGKTGILIKVKCKEFSELNVLVSRLRPFTPLDEALS